jgi:hypothetical protein
MNTPTFGGKWGNEILICNSFKINNCPVPPCGLSGFPPHDRPSVDRNCCYYPIALCHRCGTNGSCLVEHIKCLNAPLYCSSVSGGLACLPATSC